ncbi:DUF2017 family protein [Desertimonas flava]|jgi:hypothetical protein|uniref:DUF2017 family protein n=1 Tax=Desertimonas flava TaxID=2064846 RepID=UPI000E353E15|nr:DUF2017 family protein [Desertimonas flava]
MSSTGAFSRDGERFVLRLAADERVLLGRLLDELRALLSAPDGATTAPATVRLFPVAHPDDAEMEAEYQRLMRDELVASRLAGVATVEEVLAAATPGGRRGRRSDVVTFTEDQLLAFMQAVNSIRLVLGTLLNVDEDDEPADHTDDSSHVSGVVDTPEYHLYAYLSWILDSAVAVLSPGSVG